MEKIIAYRSNSGKIFKTAMEAIYDDQNAAALKVFNMLVDSIREAVSNHDIRAVDQQDILNAMSSKTERGIIREWMDACDLMEAGL